MSSSYVLNQIGVEDIFIGGETEKSLLKYLSVLLTVKGQTDKEEEVCNWLEKEISRIIREEKGDHISIIKRGLEKELGVLVKVSARKETKFCVLLDAHVDTVVEFRPPFKPLYFSQNCSEILGGKERYLVRAGGLDNRLHCAALLNMIRFARYDFIDYYAFFSIAEESGSTEAGAAKFTRKIHDLLPDYDSRRFDLIIVLDVSRGRLFPYLHESSTEGVSVIGSGHLPIAQKYPPISGSYNINAKCNVIRFRSTEVRQILNHSPRVRFGCCCSENDMHNFRSFASISDLFEFYHWMENDFPNVMSENEHFFRELMKFTTNKIRESREEFKKFFGVKYREIIHFLKGYDAKKLELEELCSGFFQSDRREKYSPFIKKLLSTETKEEEEENGIKKSEEEEMFEIISELLEWEIGENAWFVEYFRTKREKKVEVEKELKRMEEEFLCDLGEERFKLIMVDLNGTFRKGVRFFAKDFVGEEWGSRLGLMIPEFIRHADFGPEI